MKSMLLKRNIFYFVCLLGLLFSCNSENISEQELRYFEDYESPPGAWTLINLKGEQLVKPIYDNIRDPKNQLVPVNYKGKWGLITLSGEVVIPHRYKELMHSENEEVLAKTFEDQYLRLTYEGKILDTLDFSFVSTFVNGLARACTNGSCGILNKRKEWIIPPKYTAINDFENDMVLADDSEGKVLLDQSGQELIKDTDVFWISSQYLATFNVSEGYKIYNVKQGIATMELAGIDELIVGNEEHCYIKFQDKGYFYMLHSKKRMPCASHLLNYVGHGLWSFLDESKVGLISSNSDEILQPHFDLIYPFEDGFSVVALNDRWGYIDTLGNTAIPLHGRLAFGFHKGFARIIYGNSIAIIDDKARMVWEGSTKYLEVKRPINGIARAQLNYYK